MRIVKFENFDLARIQKLVDKHLGKTKLNSGFVFLNENKILEYCILVEEKNNQIKIDWIHAISGYGTNFLKRIERSLFSKYSQINLNVSIYPSEDQEVVKRRINFYIKINYRVHHIKYRKKYGPLLQIFKKKK